MLSRGKGDEMKVLWFCNCPLRDSDTGGTGSWLDAMACGLLASGAVELGIIAPGPVKQVTRSDYRHVHQWLVPGKIKLGREGLPPALIVNAIISAVKEFSPALIHVWGTEGYWGLITARGLIKYPSLLEIQGLKGPYSRVYYGGLTLPEQLRCTGIKELLKRRTMHSDRRDFERWGLYEEEIIRGHQYVDVQSSWVIAHVALHNPTARLFSMDLSLRDPFYDVVGWQPNGQMNLFCTAAYPVPYKGLHVAIRALALLRKRIPEARLRIAGGHQRLGIRIEGYMRWINRMIHHLDLDHAVDWLGPLSAEQIVAEMKNAGAVVIPTFIENCCTAMQEAMSIGIPVVVSYAGGIPSLAQDEESCLFFQTGDETMCAYQVERILTDEPLALRLSHASRKIATVRNDRQQIAQRQLDIYRQVMTIEK
jgi:glycosyltransferase involved in cell wall biosynthesis